MTSCRSLLLHAAFPCILVSAYLYPLCVGRWEFIYAWDDAFNYIENEMIQALDMKHLIQMFTETRINVYEPFAWILKAIVFALFGMQSQPVRILAAILHIGACFVLWKCSVLLVSILRKPDERVKKLLPDKMGCAISALLYCIHPLNVEVVAWPSAQPYPLAMLFISLSLLMHLKNIQDDKLRNVSWCNKYTVLSTGLSIYLAT